MTIDQLPVLADESGGTMTVATKGGADYKTPLRVITNEISANTAYNFTVANGTRFVLFISGAASSSKGAYIFNVTTSGNVSNVPILAASGLTITSSTNSVTLNCTGAGSYAMLIMSGTVTAA